MDRQNHYESAFEAYLRTVRMPYVAVDESKKALFAGSKLKSFDFVVYSKGGRNLLVDVKGRKATDGGGGAAPLQTWATRRDVEDLAEWERIFGDGFRAVFAFVFEIDPVLTPPPGHFAHRRGGGLAADERPDTLPGDVHGGGAVLAAASERHYLMLGVDLADFRRSMTRRSVKWDTVAMPAADFRSLARPIGEWL